MVNWLCYNESTDLLHMFMNNVSHKGTRLIVYKDIFWTRNDQQSW